MWNNEGIGTQHIDTIRIDRGTFEYEADAPEATSSWTLVYPNMSTLTFFGRSKDVIKLKGKANELRRVEVSGNEDNALYTAFRLDQITADSIITAHPTTAVARHLFQTIYINNEKADGKAKARLFKTMSQANPADSVLQGWKSWAKSKPQLRVGSRLPHFTAIGSEGDTITDTTFKDKKLLIGVWLSSEAKSRDMLRAFRALYRKDKARDKFKKGKTKKDKDKTARLGLLTINVDLDPKTRATFEKMDSIEWPRVNSTDLFNHPLLKRWDIDTAPYIILVDSTGIVRAMGTDYEHDIKPKL